MVKHISIETKAGSGIFPVGMCSIRRSGEFLIVEPGSLIYQFTSALKAQEELDCIMGWMEDEDAEEECPEWVIGSLDDEKPGERISLN